MEDWSVVKQLGKGSFGTCLLVKRKDSGQHYAMKQISGFGKEDRKAVIKEIDLHRKLQHGSIVRFRQAFFEHDKIMIVMDYCDGGDLHRIIQRQKGTLFEEHQIMDWFIQLLAAVSYMHEMRVLHRDIKPQNVFLANGTSHIKLGDFGISRTLMATNEKAKTVIGTPYYLSPEIISSLPYSYASDIWALGCLLYELCTLRTPFAGNSFQQLALRISTGRYRAVSKLYPAALRGLVSAMLLQNPDKRPSASTLSREPYVKDSIKAMINRLPSAPKQLQARSDVVPEVRRVVPRERPRSVEPPPREHIRDPSPRPCSREASPKSNSRDQSPRTFVDHDAVKEHLQLRKKREANSIRPSTPPTASPVVKVSMAAKEPDEHNLVVKPMKKDFASVVEQLKSTLTTADGPAEPLAPALNLDVDEALSNELQLDLTSPAGCRLDKLAMHIETRMSFKVFKQCLNVLRHLNVEDDGYAEAASMEVIDLIGDKHLDQLPLIWQYMSLETQTFGAWVNREESIPQERLSWNAGET